MNMLALQYADVLWANWPLNRKLKKVLDLKPTLKSPYSRSYIVSSKSEDLLCYRGRLEMLIVPKQYSVLLWLLISLNLEWDLVMSPDVFSLISFLKSWRGKPWLYQDGHTVQKRHDKIVMKEKSAAEWWWLFFCFLPDICLGRAWL